MNRSALFIAGLTYALIASGVALAQRVAFPTPTQSIAPGPSAVSTSAFASAPVTPPLIPSTPYAAPVAAPYSAPAAPITPLPASPAAYPSPVYPAAPSPYSAAAPVSQPAYAPGPLAPSTYAPPPSAISAPPAFDPYAPSGSALGPPPPAVPYNYTPPPQLPANAYPYPPPSATVPQTAPVNPYGTPAQPGVPTVQSDEGYIAKTQRLLQEVSFEQTYLYAKPNSDKALGINRSELAASFAVPMFGSIDTPLLITPGFAANWLQGPDGGPPPGPELPPRVYDAYLDFAWYPHINPWLGGELGFRTGVWSDFDHVTTDSIRFLGRGLASISLNPTLDVLFGVVYLDRVDIKILPAGGIYWRPTPDWDCYLVFPNPKIRRYWTTTGNTKWYYYAAGEYGAGSWTVSRGGVGDRIDINDIRVIGGIEWETQTMLRGHIEAGYVFNRDIVYADTSTPDFKPSDTFMVRGGIEF